MSPVKAMNQPEYLRFILTNISQAQMKSTFHHSMDSNGLHWAMPENVPAHHCGVLLIFSRNDLQLMMHLNCCPTLAEQVLWDERNPPWSQKSIHSVGPAHDRPFFLLGKWFYLSVQFFDRFSSNKCSIQSFLLVFFSYLRLFFSSCVSKVNRSSELIAFIPGVMVCWLQ